MRIRDKKVFKDCIGRDWQFDAFFVVMFARRSVRCHVPESSIQRDIKICSSSSIDFNKCHGVWFRDDLSCLSRTLKTFIFCLR